MNSLQIQDVFAPYYAGREEKDLTQLPRQHIEPAESERQAARPDSSKLIAGRRRSIRSVRGGAKGL